MTIAPFLLAAVCTLQFDAPRAYEVPSTWETEKIEVADLDGDRDPDIIVSTESAYLRYGTANGRLSDAVMLGARRAIVADVDRDRQPDLVVAYDTPVGPRVGVRMNRGRRVFAETKELAAVEAREMVAGDFTNDGAPDLLLMIAGGPPLFLRNDGRGGFTPQTGAVPAPFTGLRVHTGEFNGDGNLDFAADSNPSVQLFSGNGNGSFTAGPVLGQFRTLQAVADLDGDGKDEVITSGEFSMGVAVWRGGTSAQSGFGTTAQALVSATGDFNGDGRPDVASMTTYGVQVLLNDGRGGLAAAGDVISLSAVGYAPLAAADFDSDGRDDLVVPAGLGVAIFRSNGDGTFRTLPRTATLTATFIADVDGDGADERIVVPRPGEIVVMRGNAIVERITDAGSGQIPVYWDPKLRQLLTRSDIDMKIHARRASGTWSVRATVNVSVRDAILADFNGDGTNEIAFVIAESGVLKARIISAVTGATTFEVPLAPRATYYVRAADMNGDTRADLVLTNAGGFPATHHDHQPAPTGWIDVYFSTGGSFGAPRRLIANRAFAETLRGEFNGDGAEDLAVADYEGNIHIFRGSTTGDIRAEMLVQAPPYFPPFELEVGDLDRDGLDDLVASQMELNLRVFTGSAAGLVDRGAFVQPMNASALRIFGANRNAPRAVLLREHLTAETFQDYILQPTCAPARRRGVRK